MVANVLKAPLLIQPNTSNSNNNAEIATMPPYDLSDDVAIIKILDEARVVYEKLLEGIAVEDTCRSDVLNKIKHRLHKRAESTKMSFRTASLWVEYIGMVAIPCARTL